MNELNDLVRTMFKDFVLPTPDIVEIKFCRGYSNISNRIIVVTSGKDLAPDYKIINSYLL